MSTVTVALDAIRDATKQEEEEEETIEDSDPIVQESSTHSKEQGKGKGKGRVKVKVKDKAKDQDNDEEDANGKEEVGIELSDLGSSTEVRSNVSATWKKPEVPVILQFKNLTYKIKIKSGEDRSLLTNVSGVIKPGRLLALMGPTGSGKTTLLSVLAGRVPTLEPTSQLLINGNPIQKDYKRQVAFVLQDDVLFDNLTVQQTFYYTACLRLGSLTEEERMEKVNEIINLLNINKARDTLIGNQMARGVSGGERKRVNIGNELLTQPSIILLDEPTSGLDTSTGLLLIQLMKGMTDVGLTVAAAIHQPSSQMFDLFDDLMLLVDGNVVYCGPADEAVTYFAAIGYKCQKFFNPADFMMGLILQEELKKQEGTTMREKLIESWKDSKWSATAGDIVEKEDVEKLEDYKKRRVETGLRSYGTTFWKQVEILSRRSFHQTKHIVFKFDDFFQTFFISVIVSILWWNLPYDLDYFNDRLGLIFFVSTYVALFFPAFKALFTFPSERAVILRERTSGSYRLSAYFVSKCLNELVFMWQHPLLMIVITYFTTNLHLDPANFFVFIGLSLVIVWTSASIGLFVSAMNGPDVGKALTTMTLVAMTQFLTGGFFVQHFPSWIKWLYYLSYVKYSLDAYIINELRGTTWFVSNTSMYAQSFNTSLVDGSELLTMVFLDQIGHNVLVILLFGAVFRVMAFFALQYSMAAPKAKDDSVLSKCQACCACDEEEDN